MNRSLMVGIVTALLGASSIAPGGAQGKKTTDPALLRIANNGQVLHSPNVTAVFWGPEWNDPAFARDIITGLDTLLSGYSGSDYAKVATEYYDGGGAVSPFAPYAGHVIDPATPPAPGGLTGSAIIAEACKVTNNQPDPYGIYVVYSSTDKGTLGGSACGRHTYGMCGTGKKAVPIQAIGVPYTTGTLESGCNGVQDTETGHSLALAQMANVTMHELIETITDPRNTGWHDGNGLEIGNKCILVFPPSFGAFPVFSNGSVWKLQAMWSNAAYLSNSGTLNNQGEPGCRW